jgi:alpha/beta superfamily hydrolase
MVAGVVVAHPHPQRGGTMNNNVVMALCEGLGAAGIAWLRFNFRGVGQSEGRYGEGVDEVQDVLGALTYLAAQPLIARERIGLAGYSFGARVSLAVAPLAPQLRALLCVAPPLREPLPPAAHPACPFLVLVGDRDGNVAEGVDRYASCLPHPQQLRVVEGTDHFWWGYEPVLVDAAHRFFAEALPTPGAEIPQSSLPP